MDLSISYLEAATRGVLYFMLVSAIFYQIFISNQMKALQKL